MLLLSGVAVVMVDISTTVAVALTTVVCLIRVLAYYSTFVVITRFIVIVLNHKTKRTRVFFKSFQYSEIVKKS